MRDDLQSLFEADLRGLRNAAPPPPPAWRVVDAARARAAPRRARRGHWVWAIAGGVLVLGAIPVLLHDPRALPGLVAPLLLGAFVCHQKA
jgi:hypothetical protein